VSGTWQVIKGKTKKSISIFIKIYFLILETNTKVQIVKIANTIPVNSKGSLYSKI